MNIVAKTLETALGKRCDPHMVAFDQATAGSHSLVELTAIWTPVVDTLLSLVAYRDLIDDFAASLADETYTKRVADEIKGLLHAMGSAEKHQPFAQRISGT